MYELRSRARTTPDLVISLGFPNVLPKFGAYIPNFIIRFHVTISIDTFRFCARKFSDVMMPWDVRGDIARVRQTWEYRYLPIRDG